MHFLATLAFSTKLKTFAAAPAVHVSGDFDAWWTCGTVCSVDVFFVRAAFAFAHYDAHVEVSAKIGRAVVSCGEEAFAFDVPRVDGVLLNDGYSW